MVYCWYVVAQQGPVHQHTWLEPPVLFISDECGRGFASGQGVDFGVGVSRAAWLMASSLQVVLSQGLPVLSWLSSSCVT